MKEGIRIAIAQAFVFGFRIVMLICAALAMMSAAVASRMIPSRRAEMVGRVGHVAIRRDPTARSEAMG
jgi:hypothetical protein